jgi:membrane protease YdiL (CAAX protease family)
MGPAAAVVATVLVAVLVFVQPVRGVRRFDRLRLDVEVDPDARSKFYRRTVISTWSMLGLVLFAALLARAAGFRVWDRVGTQPGEAWAAVVEALIVIPLSALVLRSRAAGVQRALRAQVGSLRALLPVTPDERRQFVLVALTAGICEEAIFRGFGFGYVRWLWPGSSDLQAVLLVSIVFGLAHLYQGVRGVVLTGLVGFFLGYLTVWSGSLLPAVIVHALIDLRVAVLPAIPAEPPAPGTP